MASGAEALTGQSQIQAALDAGIEQVSSEQEVAFRQFTRVALSADGTVFWVATEKTANAKGSLHYATDRHQDEDETIAANQFLFNSETEITQFNAVAPSVMWIGTWPITGGSLRVAFAQRGNYFAEANVWHYSGFAIYPALQTQIIDDPADLPSGPIVSNSLPIFLAQSDLAPVFPSFLVPDNLAPPYVVVHIAPEATEALSGAPIVGPWPGVVEPDSGASPEHLLSVSQLCRDTVEITLYGFSNALAWAYLANLYESSESGSAPFGFANSPAIVDEKRAQVEIAAIAQKKRIVLLANYDQGAANTVARRLILSAAVTDISILGGIPTQGAGRAYQTEQLVTAEGTIDE
jgi:hypothetical protein